MNKYEGLVIATSFMLVVAIVCFVVWLIPEKRTEEPTVLETETVESSIVDTFKLQYDEYGQTTINSTKLLCTIRNYNDVNCCIYLEKDGVKLTETVSLNSYSSCYVLELKQAYNSVSMNKCKLVFETDNGSSIKCDYTISVNKEDIWTER